MRPGRPTPLTLTRRALGTRLAGFAAAIGFGQSAATSVAAQQASALDPELRDAACGFRKVPDSNYGKSRTGISLSPGQFRAW
jgi:hypothetical protein